MEEGRSDTNSKVTFYIRWTYEEFDRKTRRRLKGLAGQ